MSHLGQLSPPRWSRSPTSAVTKLSRWFPQAAGLWARTQEHRGPGKFGEELAVAGMAIKLQCVGYFCNSSLGEHGCLKVYV